MLSVDIAGTGLAPGACLSPDELKAAHEMLTGRQGPGAEYTDWLTWPRDYPRDEYERIERAAQKIRSDSSALIVIGIGGSYLGARAVLDALGGVHYNLKRKNTPNIFFAGNNMSPSYLQEILELIDGRDFSINVISKSGTTTEPAVAFRIFREALEKRYGRAEAARRIYATTDKDKGALRALCEQEGYERFVIPNGIGGRFSVFTPVGLLPLAVAGIDTAAFLRGAENAMRSLSRMETDNPAWLYAGARQRLYRQGKSIEVLAVYEPDLRFVCEWWKQLFGESEGKDGKGLFPASLELTADLHSMGQYMQDGVRCLMETVLVVDEPGIGPVVPPDPESADQLEFLAGRPVSELNRKAFLGTYLAHVDGGAPNMVLHMPRLDAYNMGELLYFFMLSCGISGRLLGVNPFDQPGVEAYKKNMFALLGKPGYEEAQKELCARLPIRER